MISLYSIPAALAFLAKIVILYFSRRAHLQTSRAKIFRTAISLSMLLNIAEFVILQLWSYQIAFTGVVIYYAVSALVIPMLVHLAISISFDEWDQPQFTPIYIVLYGFGTVLAVMFAVFTPLMATGVENMRGYTVTTQTGRFYWLYQSFLVLNFLSILLLPLYGLRKEREERAMSQK